MTDTQLKSKLKSICDAAEMLNLEINGRPDCKNCALLETIQELLQPETPEERKRRLSDHWQDLQ